MADETYVNFSQRYGYEPVRDVIQLESMDDPLRNGLWSMLKIFVWDRAHHLHGVFDLYLLSDDKNKAIKTLCWFLWIDYFKEPLDKLDDNWNVVLKQLREHFFNGSWHTAYKFIEFVANNYSDHYFKKEFTAECNRILEREMAGYRFTDGLVTPITDTQELAAIEEAMETTPGPVGQHLRHALERLSDRTEPDYRNSIKESISAVESLVAKTASAGKPTFGQLLSRLQNERGLHPALKAAFGSLYGYTSDESGVRHALTEDGRTVDFHEAKFMLVVCSAFVNFVNGKGLVED